MRSGKKMIGALGIIMGIVLLGIACGDFKGPASNDSKVGALVKVSEIMPQDRNEGTHDIDMRVSVCAMEGATITDVEDPLTEASMSVTIFNDDETSACAATGCPDVYILSYKVEFESDDPNAVPLSSIQRDIYLFVEAGDEVSDEMVLMPWSTKQQFMHNYAAWGSITPYTVKLTFKGEDEFGAEIEFHAQTYVACGDWLVCG